MTKKKLDESATAIKNTQQYEDKYRESLVRIENLQVQVESEKKGSQEKLNKMEGLEALVKSLELKSFEVNKLKDEIFKLQQELNSARRGEMESGDDIFHDASADDCNSCHKLTQQLNRIQRNLQCELKKNSEILAELSFLRERARTFEIIEAELSLYKVCLNPQQFSHSIITFLYSSL